MQVEPGVESKRATVSDNVGHSLERALVLITSGNFVAFGVATVLLVR